MRESFSTNVLNERWVLLEMSKNEFVLKFPMLSDVKTRYHGPLEELRKTTDSIATARIIDRECTNINKISLQNYSWGGGGGGGGYIGEEGANSRHTMLTYVSV